MRNVDHKWGHEEIIVETENYCYELLHQNKGWVSSYHYHPLKQETFVPQKGEVLVNVKGTEFLLVEPYTINPNTPHSFHAVTDAVIAEVSTKHMDNDVVKLQEAYYRG